MDKKIIKSLSAGVINKIITIVSQLLLVPLYLSTLGREYYGEWILLSTIPNYLSMSDLGLNVTASTEICRLVAQKRTNDALKLFKSTNTLILYILLFFLGLFFIGNLLLDVRPILNIKLFTRIDYYILSNILIINVFISIFFGLLVGIFRAENRYDLQQNSTTVVYFIEFLFTLFSLYILKSLVCLVLTQCLIRILMSILIINKLNKDYEWFSYGFSDEIKTAQKIIPSSMYYMLVTFGHAMLLQGTTLIIGKSLGPSSVVTYNTIRTMVNAVKQFSSSIYYSYLPKFTIQLTHHDIQIRKDFNKMLLLVCSFVVLAGFILYISGDYILQMWTHGKVFIVEPLFGMMIISIILHSIWNAIAIIPHSINLNSKLKLFTPLTLLLIFALNYSLPMYGINSIGIGMIVFDCIMVFYTYSIADNILNQNNINSLAISI